MSFCHCHLHGEFSILDGIGKATDYAARAEEIEQEAVALTDHGNIAGALYHAEACHEKGIKPIIGMEAYFEPSAGASKAAGERSLGNHHLLLIAKNAAGFRNLMQLSSIGFEPERFYYNPQVDWDVLARYSEGLIATSGCVQAYLPKAIRGEVAETPEEVIARFKSIFGDDFFLEVQPHDFDLQHMINTEIVALAKQHGLPLLATIDTHYPDKDWFTTQDTVMLRGRSFAQRDKEDAEKLERGEELGFGHAYPTTWMMSEAEVGDHFRRLSRISESAIQEAIRNTAEVAARCEDFNFGKEPKVPRAQTGDRTAEEVLIEWCREGMERIGKVGDPVYEARLEHELAMFRRKGVFDYFVIIGDMVRWAKSQGIRVGPGRGSAGASLVLYLIRVTAMDPIGYDLLFERFMNDARAEMPDVDIDFQHNRRDEVIQYMIDKYGKENVAYVAAFQSFGMKSVIQTVARAFDLDFGEAKRASDALDDIDFGETLTDVVDRVGHERLLQWSKDYPDAWDVCCKLEGQIKGQSKHAAAIVVTDRPVPELMPTMRVTGVKTLRGDSDETKDDAIVTQWSARANAELISTYGFLKIDALVTEGLTVQQYAIDLIKQRHGVTIDFEDPIEHPEVELPAGELEVCERFSHGSNLGIFQFGGPACRAAGVEVQPQIIDHLIAANAMSRPGPMAFLKDYAKRKNGIQEWSVPEKAAPVLDRTFGILCYQEQVMQLFVHLAGVDPSTADVARKVVGKGVARDVEGRAKLEELRKVWTEGCRKNGVDAEYSANLFQALLEMSTYSFNRAHAAGYALQAYQDQWLKYHYPVEFYTALLTFDTDKHAQTIREARASQIEILPPDVNESGEDFALVGDTIRFGLQAIQGVGPQATEAIQRLRPFQSLEHFDHVVVENKAKRALNSKVRTALIGSGAFDFDGQRDGLTQEEKAELEIQLIKFAPSMPSELAQYLDFLREYCTLDSIDRAEDEDVINIAGEVTEVKKRKTKAGKPFAFVSVWYDGQDVDVVFWQEKLEKYADLLQEGRALLIRGEWDADRHSLTAKLVEPVSRLAGRVAEEEADAS